MKKNFNYGELALLIFTLGCFAILAAFIIGHLING